MCGDRGCGWGGAEGSGCGVVGVMSRWMQGQVCHWVQDHRRHCKLVCCTRSCWQSDRCLPACPGQFVVWQRWPAALSRVGCWRDWLMKLLLRWPLMEGSER
jgi:hypothetical protein